jgi:hypothetical protein
MFEPTRWRDRQSRLAGTETSGAVLGQARPV